MQYWTTTLAHANISPAIYTSCWMWGFVHMKGHCVQVRQDMAQRAKVNGRTTGLDSSAATTGAHRVSYMSICAAPDHEVRQDGEPRCCVGMDNALDTMTKN